MEFERPNLMRNLNAQRVTIMMNDGTAFRGYVNIGSSRRLSDFFRKPDVGPFVVIFDAVMGENKESGVYFLNWSHILWIEPNELEDRLNGLDNITLESELV